MEEEKTKGLERSRAVAVIHILSLYIYRFLSPPLSPINLFRVFQILQGLDSAMASDSIPRDFSKKKRVRIMISGVIRWIFLFRFSLKLDLTVFLGEFFGAKNLNFFLGEVF